MVPDDIRWTRCVARVLTGQQKDAEEPLERGDRLIIGGAIQDDLVLQGVTGARLMVRMHDDGTCVLTALRPGVVCDSVPLPEGVHLEPELPAIVELDGVMLGIGPIQTVWADVRARRSGPPAAPAASAMAPAAGNSTTARSSTTLTAQVLVTSLLAAVLSVGLYFVDTQSEFSKTEQKKEFEKLRKLIDSQWAKLSDAPLEWRDLGPVWELKTTAASDAQERQLKTLLVPLGAKVSSKICNEAQIRRQLAAALADLPAQPGLAITLESQKTDKHVTMLVPWQFFAGVRARLLRFAVTDCSNAALRITLQGMEFSADRQPAVLEAPIGALNQRLTQPEFADTYFTPLLTGPYAVTQIRLDDPAFIRVGVGASSKRLSAGSLVPGKGGAQIVDVNERGIYVKHGPWVRLETGS